MIHSITSHMKNYFEQTPALLLPAQHKWQEKYGSFFKNLQDSLTKISNSLTPAITQDTSNNADKINEIGTQTLLPDTSIPDTSKIETKTNETIEALLLDTKTIVKKLNNGFTYYIRHNAYPSKNTASLHLVVRVGSTTEEEHEQGIAHFLEHLLFEGTESYGKQEIKHLLESEGAIFGADQNAHTSFNETVYKFNIPLSNPELINKTLHILREMATKATIADSAVEEERAVILDEISSESAAERYNKKRNAVLFEGSPYPHRYPSGMEKIVRKCTSDQIRKFYIDHYLPQNMALVAVGDFDKTEVEGLIQKHFSDIPHSSVPAIKHDFQPIERTESQFVCHVDPECTFPILQLHYPLTAASKSSEATLINLPQTLIDYFYHHMFNERLKEIISADEYPPFTYAKGYKKELVENFIYYRLTLLANEDTIPEAHKRILLELKRVQEHGFLPEEFEQAKKSYKTQLEHQESEKDHISNQELAKHYVSHFTDNDLLVDIPTIIRLKKELIDSVKLSDINLWSKILVLNPATVISAFLPESAADAFNPEIAKKINLEVSTETTSPYTYLSVDRPLLRHIPKPGEIIETTVFEKIGTTQWTLENGMNVYVRPSVQNEDTILIYANSIGGELSAPFEKRAAADIAATLYAESGTAGLTSSELNKIFKGTTIKQKIIISNYTTSLLTTSSKKDLETAFQLLYAAYNDRTLRENTFKRIKKENIDDQKHLQNSPEVQLVNIRNALCTQNHPRFQSITTEEYEKVDFQEVVDFLNQQFQNPGNFNLIITGNVDPEVLKALVEKYMAGIPSQGIRKNFDSIDFPGYEYPSGIVSHEIEGGIKSQCLTHISFPASSEDILDSRQLGMFTAGLLNTHLYDRLRLLKAENYSVECDYAITQIRGQEKTDPSSMEIEISGLPENIRELNKIVLDELKRLQEDGFTKEEITCYCIQLKEAYRKQLDIDSTWMSMLAHHSRWGADLNMIVENYHRLLDGFNENMAQEQLKKLFPLNRYVLLTQFPKKMAAIAVAPEIFAHSQSSDEKI